MLPPGGTVYLLGGTAALTDAVEQQVAALPGSYDVRRLGGGDRFETAVAIAQATDPDPSTILLATGVDFPDGLAAGAVARLLDGVVLLTAGELPIPATDAALAAHPSAVRYAVGGPAARAYPGAIPIVGTDRIDTAVRLAQRFFGDDLRVAGLARADAFPDALSGGAHIGGVPGPLLLTWPDRLPEGTRSYLEAHRTIDVLFVYGGEAAVGRAVHDAAMNAIRNVR